MNNEPVLMTKPVVFEVNGEEVKLSGEIVRNYLVNGGAEVTDQEIVMFLNLCRYQHLNPFLNEAYLVKFGDDKAQIITSKEAFMKRAEAHPQYDGFEAGIVIEKDGELIDIEGSLLPPKASVKGGWARIFRKDRTKATYVRLNLSEFSKGQATWKSMPQTMIRKTAIVNALREAFPSTLGALYTEEEPNVNASPVPVEEQVRRDAEQLTATTEIDIVPEITHPLPEDIERTQHEIYQEELFQESTITPKERGF